VRQLALVCLGAAFLVAPTRAQDLPPDLGAVPGDALGFIHVRVAEVWKGEALKDIRKVIEKAGPEALKMLDERFVPAPSSLDRATVIFWAPAKPDAEVPMIAVLALSKPFDQSKLLKGTLPGAKPAAAGDAKYFADETTGMALQILGERTILFGSLESVKGYLTRGVRDRGVFGDVLRSHGNRSITVAINPSLLPKELLAEIPPPLAPLMKANLLFLGATLGKQAAIDARLSYADEAGSKEAEKAVQAGLGHAKQMLAEYKKQAEEKLFAKNKGERSALEDLPEAAAALAALGFVNKVEEILGDFPLKRDGSSLAASIVLPEGPYTTAISGVAVSAGLLLPAVQKVREAAARMKSSNNIKQISLSFHNFESTYQRLPAAAICDRNGKPLLSWRVAILPYIEQDNLYKQFKLDEPWDSEHNIKLIQTIPAVYVHPSAPKVKSDYPLTHYQVLVGNNAAFDLKKGSQFADFTDGLSNTIWLVEAEKGVPWTKPDDIEYDPKKLPALGKFFPGGVNAGFADGSVRFITHRVPASTWHLLIQRNDGQVIPDLDK
jgi:prepilin-type processing-associated H-X9-DG protein